jgi:hypothetical protein
VITVDEHEGWFEGEGSKETTRRDETRRDDKALGQGMPST